MPRKDSTATRAVLRRLGFRAAPPGRWPRPAGASWRPPPRRGSRLARPHAPRPLPARGREGHEQFAHKQVAHEQARARVRMSTGGARARDQPEREISTGEDIPTRALGAVACARRLKCPQAASAASHVASTAASQGEPARANQPGRSSHGEQSETASIREATRKAEEEGAGGASHRRVEHGSSEQREAECVVEKPKQV